MNGTDIKGKGKGSNNGGTFDTFIDGFQRKAGFYKAARKSYLNAYQKDPLAKLLVAKLKLSPVKAGLLGFCIVALTYLAGFIQYLLTGHEVAGITQTPLDFVYDLYIVTLVYGYYIWVSTRPPFVFLELQENGVAVNDSEAYNRFVSRHVNGFINSKTIFLLSFLTSFGLACLAIIKGLAGTTVWGAEGASHFLLYFVKIPITWAIPWYMVCVIFLKEAATIWTFRKMLKQGKLNIDLFNKDRCGGLKPISDYLLTVVYFVVACGFGLTYLIARSISFGYFNFDTSINISFVVYLGLTYLFFLFPLHPVHKAMRKLGEEIRSGMGWDGFLPVRAFTGATLLKYTSGVLAPLLLRVTLYFL